MVELYGDDSRVPGFTAVGASHDFFVITKITKKLSTLIPVMLWDLVNNMVILRQSENMILSCTLGGGQTISLNHATLWHICRAITWFMLNIVQSQAFPASLFPAWLTFS